jgi:phosphohistidine phosphatase
MRIFLVQHGEAKPKEEDPQRPLTPRGEEEVRLVAEFAKRVGVQVEQIRHSGKRRAEQTAAIFGEYLRPRHGIVATSGLDPNDEIEALAEALNAATEPCMIVGHLPYLARLAAKMITGNRDCSIIRFQMGGIVCLERDDGGVWSLAWMVTPDLL